MKDAPSAVPSCRQLEQEGYSFLRQGQFKAACLCFEKALSIDKNRHSSCFGMLLCEYQCKTEYELYSDKAIPFNKNENYLRATETADTETRDAYTDMLKCAFLFCHAKIIDALLSGDVFIAKKRIKLYGDFCKKDDSLATAHKLLEENGFNFSPGICCYLLFAYSSLFTKSNNADICSDFRSEKEKLKTTVVNIYRKFSREFLEETLLSSGCTNEQTALWCNPVKNLPVVLRNSAYGFAGVDEKGHTVSERCCNLIEILKGSQQKITALLTKKIFPLYDAALENADDESLKVKINSDRSAFFRSVIDTCEEKDSVLEYLVSAYPNNGEYSKEYIIYKTNSFSLMPDFRDDGTKEKYIITKKQTKSSASYNAERYLSCLKNLKNNLDSDYLHITEDLSAFADKAKANSDEGKDDFSKKWSEYINEVERVYRLKLAETEKLISEAQKEYEIRHKEMLRQSATRGKTMIAISVFNIFLFTGSIAALGLFPLFRPEAVISFPVILCYLVALIIGTAITALQYLICNSIETSDVNCHRYSDKISLALEITKYASVLLSAAAVIFIAVSFVLFPSKAGSFEISSAEQMKYIYNCPRADFVITKDISMKDRKFRTILLFTGSLNGNGHTVKELNAEGKRLFLFNKGTIENINFKKLKAENFCKNNGGTIQNLNFSSSVFSSSVLLKNSKSIKNITAKNCTFNFETEASEAMAFVGSGASKAEKKTFKAESCTVKNLPMYINASLGLYLRKEAGQNGTPITLMKYKEKVLIQKTKGDWSYVIYNGRTGWCHNYYLTDKKPKN